MLHLVSGKTLLVVTLQLRSLLLLLLLLQLWFQLLLFLLPLMHPSNWRLIQTARRRRWGSRDIK